jgi:threonine dehydrogenase-like Zn-dependent dehydrogenase
VVGLGVSGLLHVQLLRARGASSVLGVGRSPAKRALAEALGATATCSPDEAVDAIEATTRGEGAGVVVEAVGSESTISLSVVLAGFGAAVVVYGMAPGPTVRAPFSEMYRKELRVLHPRAAVGADYEDAIALTASGAVRAAPLVTDRLELADVPGLFSSWADHPERLKAVVDLTR